MAIGIDARTLHFASSIIQLSNSFPKTSAGLLVSKQLIRCGTSIGANVEEALGSHTKTEFVYKMNIAKSEARETKYWLRLVLMTHILSESLVNPLLSEVDELIAILTTIVKNAKMPQDS